MNKERQLRQIIKRPLKQMIANQTLAERMEKKHRERLMKEHVVSDTTDLGELEEGLYCQVCFLNIEALEDRVYVYPQKPKKGKRVPMLTICRDCYLTEERYARREQTADEKTEQTRTPRCVRRNKVLSPRGKK